jgi:glycerophosphoryl diester phosphodiesterase
MPYGLEEALTHLAGDAFSGVELDVDLKLPGYELRGLEALRRSGLLERAMISSMYWESLRRVRAAEPNLKLGWSVPRVRRDYTTDALTKIPAAAAITGYRLLLPRRAREALRAGRCDAVMAHWRVITPALVRAVTGEGGELYAWTVDDPGRIVALRALGVTGIITNDPRLFASASSGAT